MAMDTWLDKVHSIGMSDRRHTSFTVDIWCDEVNNSVEIEPPLRIVLEDESSRVAFDQEGLAVRYTNEELRLIGNGDAIVGMNRVVGYIALKGQGNWGDIKPLHPTLVDGQATVSAELPGHNTLAIQ